MSAAAPRVVALVPMRHTSERVPGKNYRPFRGRPLFHHVLRALERCPLVTETVVDTDSPVIGESCARDFPGVRVLDRPAHLRDGTTPMNDVLRHDVEVVPADVYLQTHATNPLLRAATLTAALERFLAERDRHDSLFSVTRRHVRLWSPDGRPLNHDPLVLLRTQDLQPVLEENSCLYVFTRAGLLARGSRIGATPVLFEVDPIEAWDIDEESEFQIAEALARLRGEET